MCCGILPGDEGHYGASWADDAAAGQSGEGQGRAHSWSTEEELLSCSMQKIYLPHGFSKKRVAE
jgi:hypothetical protein